MTTSEGTECEIQMNHTDIGWHKAHALKGCMLPDIELDQPISLTGANTGNDAWALDNVELRWNNQRSYADCNHPKNTWLVAGNNDNSMAQNAGNCMNGSKCKYSCTTQYNGNATRVAVGLKFLLAENITKHADDLALDNAKSGGMSKWTITTKLGNSCTMPVRNWEIVNRWDQSRPYYYSDCMFSEAEMDMEVYISAVMDEDMSDTNNATAIALKSDELGLQRVELVWTDDVKFFNNKGTPHLKINKPISSHKCNHPSESWYVASNGDLSHPACKRGCCTKPQAGGQPCKYSCGKDIWADQHNKYDDSNVDRFDIDDEDRRYD